MQTLLRCHVSKTKTGSDQLHQAPCKIDSIPDKAN
jgi:hypothetical protein